MFISNRYDNVIKRISNKHAKKSGKFEKGTEIMITITWIKNNKSDDNDNNCDVGGGGDNNNKNGKNGNSEWNTNGESF